MNNKWLEIFNLYSETDISCETADFCNLTKLISKLQPATVVVFTGRTSADITGAWQALLNALKALNVELVRFSDIEPEPGIETTNKMLDFLCKKNPDQVIALGGGSVIDAAKAAWVACQTGRSIKQLFGSNMITDYTDKKLQRIIAIPTTSGTGSEVTPYSNIVDHQTQVKYLISDPAIIPEYSFLCPEFTKFMPAHVTLATACDALAHSLEGFLNVRQDDAHPDANNWALESMKLVIKYLPRALQQPDNLEAREALAVAACLGGMVIRYKSTGLPHLCSFSWAERIEHGIAVAIMIPYALEYYTQAVEIKARVMELVPLFPGDSSDEVILSYRKFLDSCGVANSLNAFPDFDQALLEKTANSAAGNRMKLELAPKPVPLEQSYEILTAILNNAYVGTIKAANQ
jgi:alcohol dehydrogenase class IV